MSSVGQRQLFQHGGAYALTSMLTTAMSFVALPIYAHALGAAGMGLVEVLAVTMEVLSFLVSQGLGSAWFRLRFNYDGEARRRFESAVLLYVVASSIALLGAAHIIGPMLAEQLTPGVAYYPLWFLTVLTACAMTVGDLFGLRLQAEQRSRSYALFALLRRALLLGTSLVLVVGLQGGAEGKVRGEALAAAAVAVVCWWLLRPSHPGPQWRDMLRSVFSYSLPVLPHALAVQAILTVDRLVLTQTIGLGAVGVYAIGVRTARVMETINIGMSTAFRAVFIAHAKRFEAARDAGADAEARDELDELARLGLTIFAVACLLCQATCAVVFDALRVLLPGHGGFGESWSVVPVLAFGMLAHASYHVFAQSILYVPAQTRRLPLSSGAGAIASVLASLVLIPRFGMHGAACANAIGWITMAACAFMLGRRVLPIRHRFRGGLSVLALTMALLIACYVIDLRVQGLVPRVATKLVLLVVAAGVTWRLAGLPRKLLSRGLHAQTSTRSSGS